MNTIEPKDWREQISALADGQLAGEAFAAAVEQLDADEDARANWHLYHLIGDVLRSGDIGSGQHDREFVSCLRVRLQAEPGVPRPVAAAERDPETIADNDHKTLGNGVFDPVSRPAANDRTYRWKMLAGLAAAVAVGSLVWNGWGGEPVGLQLTQSSAPTRVDVALGGGSRSGTDGTEASILIRDPHLDALLAAHRQFGGGSALQNPAGFLRSATLDASAFRPLRVSGP